MSQKGNNKLYQSKKHTFDPTYSLLSKLNISPLHSASPLAPLISPLC